MPYTDETLAVFMVTKLGATGVALSLTAMSAAIVEAVADVAAVLDSDIADLTDDLKTRTVAEWQAWRAAKGAAAGQYDLKAGTVTTTRSQVWDHIVAMLADAEAAASRYDEVTDVLASTVGTVYVTNVTSTDPYVFTSSSEWG